MSSIARFANHFLMSAKNHLEEKGFRFPPGAGFGAHFFVEGGVYQNKILVTAPRDFNGEVYGYSSLLPYTSSSAICRAFYAEYLNYQWNFSQESRESTTTILLINEMFERELSEGANKLLALKGLTPHQSEQMGMEEVGHELRNAPPAGALLQDEGVPPVFRGGDPSHGMEVDRSGDINMGSIGATPLAYAPAVDELPSPIPPTQDATLVSPTAGDAIIGDVSMQAGALDSSNISAGLSAQDAANLVHRFSQAAQQRD